MGAIAASLSCIIVINACVCSSESDRKFMTKTIGGGSGSSARASGEWSISSSRQAMVKPVFLMAFSFVPLVGLCSGFPWSLKGESVGMANAVRVIDAHNADTREPRVDTEST